MDQSMMAHPLTDHLNPPLESFEAYRAARQVARLTTIISVALAAAVIALVVLLMAMFPLKQVQPMLVTIKDNGEQVVRIEPIDKNVKALEQLKETLARQYVQLRETFDLQTEPNRWRQMSLMSSEELSHDFQELMNPNTASSPFKKRAEEKTTRSVRILSSASLAPSAPDIYQVEWVSEDWHKGQMIGREQWLTTMTVSLEERAFEYEDQYINPIGFTVNHYTVARKAELNAALDKAPEKQQTLQHEVREVKDEQYLKMEKE